MPYVTCGRCGLRTFSAAYWSSVDYCDNCGTRFPRTRRKVLSITRLRRLPAAPASFRSEAGRRPDADA
jgi:hypothetical protein